MIYNNEKQILAYRGKTYAPGDCVVCNKKDKMYCGLKGVITRIATGDDKETDESVPEIYVDFDKPTDEKLRKNIEKRFSIEYAEELTFEDDDICLEDIVLTPAMVDVSNRDSIKQLFIVRTVTRTAPFKSTKSENVEYFSNQEAAANNVLRQVALLKEEYNKWYYEGVDESFSPDLYSARGANGTYIQVSLECASVSLSSFEKYELYHEYERECHIYDIMLKIDEHAEDGKYCESTRDQLLKKIDSIVDCFEDNLSKNDGYYESYWASVDESLRTAIEE